MFVLRWHDIKKNGAALGSFKKNNHIRQRREVAAAANAPPLPSTDPTKKKIVRTLFVCSVPLGFRQVRRSSLTGVLALESGERRRSGSERSVGGDRTLLG